MSKYVTIWLCALFFAGSALACTEILYNTTVQQGAISGRLMDLGNSVAPTFSYIPRNALLQGFRTRAGGNLLSYTTKYGFALTHGQQDAFRLSAKAFGFTTPAVGSGTDGLNEKGLSAAILYDSGITEVFASANVTETTVSVLDVVTYTLSQYASVDEVRQAINNKQLLISEPYDKIPEVQKIFADPYHFVFRDTSHDQLVVEYNTQGELLTFNEKTYVLTNGPQFPTHLQQLQQFLTPAAPGARPPYLQAPQGATPQFNNLTFSANNLLATTVVPDQWWPFPGDYSSQSRFIRMNMLAQIVGTSAVYPTEAINTWSPAAYPGPYPSKVLFTAIDSFLSSAYLPLGVDDKGGINPPSPTAGDFLQFKTIRDHVNKLYWFQTPSSPFWKLIDVGKLASQPQQAYTGDSLSGTYGADRAWFDDVTKIAQSSPADVAKQELALKAVQAAQGIDIPGLGKFAIAKGRCDDSKLYG